MKRYRRYEVMPDKPFGYVSLEWDDGKYYDACWLWLPIWGMFYDVITNSHRWGQRVLRWHGREGFSLSVRFPDNGRAQP